MPLTFLQNEKIKAMKNKDEIKKQVLSEIIDTCQKATITNKGRVELTKDLVNECLIKYQKMIKEMVDTCPAERVELLKNYNEQLAIVDEYAPKLIVDEKEVKDFILNLDIEINKSNRGLIMKELKGKVDMKVANKVLGELL